MQLQALQRQHKQLTVDSKNAAARIERYQRELTELKRAKVCTSRV